jgi:hypothetical protein
MKNPFKKNTSSNNEKITVIDVTKELLSLKIVVQNWIMKNVQNIAKYLSVMVGTDININHIPAVVHIRQVYQSKVNEIGSVFDKNLSHFQTVYNKFEKSFGGDTPHAEIDKQKDIEMLSSEKNKVLGDASVGHMKDMADEEKTIEKLERTVKDKEDKLKSLPKHNLLGRKISSGIVAAFLVLAEIYMNRDAYEYAGFYDPASTLIGIGIATGTYAASFGLALTWRSQKYSMGIKIMATVAILGVVSAVYYVLGVIRMSQISGEGSEGTFNLSPAYFMTMNLLLFMGIFLSKLLLYPSPQQISDNEVYDGAKNDLKESQKNLTGHKERFFNGYQLENEKREQVKKDFDKKINPIISTIKIENEAFRKAALDFNTELAQARNFFAQTNADYKSSVALLFNTVPEYIDGKAMLLDMNALENLDNPFVGISLLSVTPEELMKIPHKTSKRESLQNDWKVMVKGQNGETNYSFINPKKQ